MIRPELTLAELQADLETALARSRRRDLVAAGLAALLATALLGFLFGRPCERGEFWLGHAWCESFGPWSYWRLAVFLVADLAIVAPLTFRALRRRRRRHYWRL
jgi:hypothetical protein